MSGEHIGKFDFYFRPSYQQVHRLTLQTLNCSPLGNYFLLVCLLVFSLLPNAFYRQRLFHSAISLTFENYSQPLKWSLHLCSGLQSHFAEFQILQVHKLAFVCVLKQVHICRPLSALLLPE